MQLHAGAAGAKGRSYAGVGQTRLLCLSQNSATPDRSLNLSEGHCNKVFGENFHSISTLSTKHVGLARTIEVWCLYDDFGREITDKKCTLARTLVHQEAQRSTHSCAHSSSGDGRVRTHTHSLIKRHKEIRTRVRTFLSGDRKVRTHTHSFIKRQKDTHSCAHLRTEAHTCTQEHTHLRT